MPRFGLFVGFAHARTIEHRFHLADFDIENCMEDADKCNDEISSEIIEK